MQLKTTHPGPWTNHRYIQKHGCISRQVSQTRFQVKEGRPPKRTCALWVCLPQVQQLDRLTCVSGVGRVVILWSWGGWLGGYDSLLGSWGREGWECCVSWVKVLVAHVFGLQNFIGCILWLVHLSTSMLCINRDYLNIFMGSCIVQTRLDPRESSKINGEETLPIVRRSIRRPNGWHGLAGWPQARDPISLRDRRTGSHFPICKLRLNSFPQSHPAGEFPFHRSLLPSKRQALLTVCLFVYFHSEPPIKSWSWKARQGGALASTSVNPTALLLRSAGGAWNI